MAMLAQVQLPIPLNPAHTGDFDIGKRLIHLAGKDLDFSILAANSLRYIAQCCHQQSSDGDRKI
jgi:hypothetical protein